jgi:hypothetical protein
MARNKLKHPIKRRSVPRKYSRTSGRWPELFESKLWMMKAVREAVAAGHLRSLGFGLYTPNLVDDPIDIIHRHSLNELGALRDRIEAMRQVRPRIRSA